MQEAASRQRGFSTFHAHYTAIRHQLKYVFITVSLLSIALIYALILAGDYGR